MLRFRLGMDCLCRSTKQGCLSFALARIRVGPNICFSTAAAAAADACFCCGCLCCCCRCCCCLLLLLASAAGASVAAAAAALFVGPALCFRFCFFRLDLAEISAKLKSTNLRHGRGSEATVTVFFFGQKSLFIEGRTSIGCQKINIFLYQGCLYICLFICLFV